MSRWLWLPLLITIGAAAGFYRSRNEPTRPPDTPHPTASLPTPVAVATSRLGTMPVFFDSLGSVTPYQTVTVRSRVDGQLLRIYYREGQMVRPGALLAEIDPRPFQVQLEQAEGQMARDQAALANARLDLERYKLLVSQDAVPRQQADTQAALVAQYEAVIKTDQAAIDNARLQLSYCRIVAPIGGRVGLRLVDAGNIVHAGDQNGLLVITQVQPIATLFTLPEDDLSAVLGKLRAGASLQVDAYNRDKSRRLASGKLLTVDNLIDPSTGTVRFKAVFSNRENSLFPNQFVNIRLLVEVRRNQVIVPSVAIQRGAQGTYVYRVTVDHRADLMPVTVGISEGNETSIISGLGPGERVVVDGTDRLQPGQKVMIRPVGPHGGRSL